MNESKRGGRPWLAIILVLALLVIPLAAVAALIALLASRQPEIEEGSILEVELVGAPREGPARANLQALLTPAQLSMWELRRGLKAAAEDPDIAGVRLSVHNASMGWGAAEELLQLLATVREHEKPVYASLQGDLIADLDYFLASSADRIWMNPTTGSLVNGLVAEVLFFRGTLDKLKINPEVIMLKEYKSAGEPFANEHMSPYMREALARVLQVQAERFEEHAKQRRGVDATQLQELLARGVATASDLQQAGLVDELGYLDQVNRALAESSDREDYQGVSLKNYLATLPDEPDNDGIVAVVFGEGQIVTRGSFGPLPPVSPLLIAERVASHLREAADDERVRAIVFRVDSPGGSAAGSDLVRREIERARDKNIPVIASMSSVAGSGGYWIAMDADSIVAHPTTITGSIGVVFAKFDVTGLLQWAGANIDRVSTAPMADILGAAPLDEERRARVEAWLQSTYSTFTGKVAEARDKSAQQVEAVAKGRVWTGRDALKHGLIDELGGMDRAIDVALERAELKRQDVSVHVYPRPKTLLESLLSGELMTETPQPPQANNVRTWLRQLSRPRVLALTPDIRVH